MSNFVNFDQIVSATRVMNKTNAAEAEIKASQEAWGDTMAGCVKTKQKNDAKRDRREAQHKFMKKHGTKIGFGMIATAIAIRVFAS